MAAIALIKFVQGLRVGGNGHALIVEAGTPVTISNGGDNSNVNSWRIELLDGPPGSAFEQVPGVPLLLAENPSSAAPEEELEPQVSFPGCYRVRMTVWTGVNYTGSFDVDIRNAAVLTTNYSFLMPPFQKLPDPLPLPSSGKPGAKPDELNFEGQPFGWSGPNYSHPLYGATYERFRALNAFIKHVDDNMGTGGGGEEDPAPENLYVSTTGNDVNDGLTPGTALATVTAARLLIGDLDGDTTINLISDVGTDTDFYVNASDTGSGIWMRPRGGSGRLTIKGDAWEDVATLDVLGVLTESVTGLSVIEVDATLTLDEYNFLFVFDVADTSLETPLVVVKTLESKLYVTSYAEFGGTQLVVKRPRVSINFNTPISVHCGHGAHVSPGQELKFDSCRPAGIFHDGRLLLDRAQLGYMSQFYRVEFTREVYSAFAALGTMTMDLCTAPQGTLFAAIAFLEATNCGGIDQNLTNVPFSVRGRVTFTNAWNSMLMLYTYVDGDILSNIENSKVVVQSVVDGYRGFDYVMRSTVTAVVKKEPDAATGGVSLSVIGVASVLDINFDDAVPDLAAFSPQMKGGILRVNRDISSMPLFTGLDFSDPSAAYRLANNSVVCREGTDGTTTQVVVGGIVDGQPCKLLLDQVVSSEQLTGTIADGANLDIAGPANVANGQFPRIFWTIILTINAIDYVADCWVSYKRAAGVLTVLETRPVATTPTGITLAGGMTGNQPQLNIANATGFTATYYVHHSTSRQVKA